VGSIHESLYRNRTNFLRRTMRKVTFRKKVSVKPEELKRISTIQAHEISQKLARHPSHVATPVHPASSVAGPSKLR
jgi:H+-transporting ATPase